MTESFQINLMYSIILKLIKHIYKNINQHRNLIDIVRI
jgi:hypothetical protein